MSYYNYNNAKLELASYAGGSWGAAVPIYVENLAISLTNNLKAIDLLPNRSSFGYLAGGGINGSLSLGYYLTGEDFLADFMEADNLISGNFAGLSFSSGVLSSYSFEVAPFGPIMVSANINFYGGLRGRFTPTRETLDADILTYTDCKLTQISGVTPHEDGETEQITASTSVSFGFASNVQPIYTVGDAVPRELRFNKKTIDASINGYALPSWDEGIGDFTSDTEQQNYLNDKFFSGIAEGELLIGFSSSNGTTGQSYKIRGTLKAHNINVTAGEKITTTLSLSQEKYQNAPAITSFTPTAGVVGATITILGTDLKDVTEVTFGDEKRVYTHFTTHTSTTIVTTIPDEAITCRVGLKSPGGDAKLGAATNYGDGMPGIFTVQDGGF